MRSITTVFAITALLAVPLAAGSFQSKDIVDTAVDAGSFDTLVAAVQAAGLADALKGDGPFTVFAPTDEAFAKLPEGTVASLLEPANVDKLRAILKYHVISGKVMASSVSNGLEAESLNGQNLTFTVDDSGAMVGAANIVSTDVPASNGVIHVIDSVLIPAEPASASTAAAAGR